jgi:sulfite exporter TauE/SafE
MTHEIWLLVITAASIGFFHTLFGPDHYLPFIVIAKARQWSLAKTFWLTLVCGLGHVGSSVLLGIIGIAFGLAVMRLEVLESFRGSIAAWALIAFGFLYFLWGLRRAFRTKPHQHIHAHQNGTTHAHTHTHSRDHVHVHEKADAVNITPWILFTIFVLGPCEPLIPLLMYPAAKSSTLGLVLVTAVFGVVTIGTMLAVVLISSFGIAFVPTKRLERFSHALAGATVCLCGIAIQFLGL